MKLSEAKSTFIDLWGSLSSMWGLPPSTAQVFAILAISPRPLNTDMIMDELSLSRGNVSTSLRELVDWGLIFKVFLPGDRKEYYEAEKDMWIATHRIVEERRRRELTPIIRTLDRIRQIDDTEADPDELAAFNDRIKSLRRICMDTDDFINTFLKSKKMPLYKWYNKLRKKVR